MKKKKQVKLAIVALGKKHACVSGYVLVKSKGSPYRSTVIESTSAGNSEISGLKV